MGKGDYSSASFNAEKMLELRKQTIEENKKRDYSNNQTLPLKDIYGLVSETLLLAKCKLISKLIHSKPSRVERQQGRGTPQRS